MEPDEQTPFEKANHLNQTFICGVQNARFLGCKRVLRFFFHVSCFSIFVDSMFSPFFSSPKVKQICLLKAKGFDVGDPKKLTAFLPLKMDAWETTFGKKPKGAFAVSFRECTPEKNSHGTWTARNEKANHLPNLHLWASKCYFSGV